MRRTLFISAVLFLISLLNAPLFGQTRHQKNETVVLIHGIMNRPFVMRKIKKALTKKRYQVVNWGYPSRSKLIEEHAAELNQLMKTLEGRSKVHIVGFSQGAIITRAYLKKYEHKNVGRFIMIAPPNRGSEKAENLYKYFWFRFFYKDKSIKQLFASNKSFFSGLGFPTVEFGIIAGGKGNNQGFSKSIPGDDDGTVSVASTRLEGSKDFIVLEHRHTLLLFSNGTIKNIISFLEEGRFVGL